MMRAVIYVRRSTDEHQAESLKVQEGEAKAFIKRKGWTLATSYLYSDDAVSRAEFKKRPALLRLLNDAEAKLFDVVVTRDETRLGGDMIRTGLLMQDLIDAGVKLFYYFAGEQVALDDSNAKFMVMARNFAAELEREKTSQRTREHMMVKAKRGVNVGGRCYGYNNEEIKDGDKRVEVRYVVNETEAAIVRELFARYAKGDGLRSIVKDFNRRRVPPPSAGKRGTGSWSISALWSMLRRDRYRGTILYGKYEKAYRKGTKVRIPRDPNEWVRADAPHLRIVSDKDWFAAHAQMRRVNRGKKGGRPHRYLLSGIARCAECGGPMTVINGRHGKENVKMYTCAYHRERGDAVCKTTTRRPVDAVDRAVVEWLQQEVIDERFVLAAAKELRRRFAKRARTASTEVPSLEREAAKLRGEIQRLVEAIATLTDKPDAVVAGIHEREERLTAVEARQRLAKEAPAVLGRDLDRVEADAKKRLAEFGEFLRERGEKGRMAVLTAFVGPIKVTTVELPAGRRFRLEGEARVGRLLATEVSNVASPAGVEPALAT